MTLLPRDSHGCPYLLLAPMEGVGDRSFRRAMASIGGFDEAVREFLRVPKCAHVRSLAKVYHSDELNTIPLAAQLMGSDPELMAAMGQEIERRGAPRIDFNCGCPSNTVTGRGAGSSLLQDPRWLYENAKALVNAVRVPVTVKMRSGFNDLSLFKENLLAAQESGARYITLHPRTKADGYSPPARWDLIAEAKATLRIPVVGNGDILTVQHALDMLRQTGCDALMIGRGSVINPFIFMLSGQLVHVKVTKEISVALNDQHHMEMRRHRAMVQFPTSKTLFTLGAGFFASEAASEAMGKKVGIGAATYVIGHATQFFASDLIDRFLPSEARELTPWIPFFISAVTASFAIKKLFNSPEHDNAKTRVSDGTVFWIRAIGESALTLLPLLAHTVLTQGCAYTENLCPPELTDWDPLNFSLNGLLA